MKHIRNIISLICIISCLPLNAQNLKQFGASKLKTVNFVQKLNSSFKDIIVIKNVEIEGTDQKFNFILDSGSEYSYISTRVADLIEFSPIVNDDITDGYEKKEIKLGFANLKFGKVEFNNVGVGIMDNLQKQNICDIIDGIIGYNIMKKCIWQLEKDSIIITDNIKNIINTTNYTVQKLFPGPTVVAGFLDGFNATMLFDLGDNGSVEIQKSRIDLIKNKEIIEGTGVLYTTGIGLGNNSEDSRHTLLKVPAFKFGNDVVNNMIVYTDSAAHLPIDIIGAGILNYFNLILDFPKKQIYSKSIRNEYNNEDFITHGFKYCILDNEMIITFIWDNSSAYKAGLKVGEKIIKLNDLDIAELSNLSNCEKYKKIDDILYLKKISIYLSNINEGIVLTKSPLFN